MPTLYIYLAITPKTWDVLDSFRDVKTAFWALKETLFGRMSVCVFVCMFACMFACVFVCVFVCMLCLYLCLYIRLVCMCVCMCVCMHAHACAFCSLCQLHDHMRVCLQSFLHRLVNVGSPAPR